MPVEIRVPEMGESITEATITRWLKKEGETVSTDEPVAELETDKVNVEVAAPQAGVLQTLAQPEGATVAVGDVIAVLGDGATGAAPGAAAPTRPEAAPTGNGQGPVPGGEAAYAVTPVARRLAEDNAVDLSRVAGTGPQGRITKEDVEGYLGRGAAAPPQATPETAEHRADQAVEYDTRPVAPPVAPPAPDHGGAGQTQPTAVPTPPLSGAGGPSPISGRPETRQRMSRRRQTIATRLVEAQHTAAMLTTFNEVDMTAMLALRARHKEAFEKRHEGVRLGFMSFFTKAVVGALKAFPLLNAEIQGTEVVLKHYVDMGIAVSTEEGLVVPVVRDADRKTFAEIEKDVADLAKRARDGKLTLAELQGGTFTITNGGVFGSLLSTPILNAPQVGILGMHKTQDRPVVVGGEVVVRPMMYLALSYDHRIVDGSEAVRFLVRVKELVEDPEQLLLEA